jgi:hypothetical protein
MAVARVQGLWGCLDGCGKCLGGVEKRGSAPVSGAGLGSGRHRQDCLQGNRDRRPLVTVAPYETQQLVDGCVGIAVLQERNLLLFNRLLQAPGSRDVYTHRLATSLRSEQKSSCGVQPHHTCSFMPTLMD